MSVKALPALAKKLPHSRSPRLISVACIGGGGIGGGGIGGRGREGMRHNGVQAVDGVVSEAMSGEKAPDNSPV